MTKGFMGVELPKDSIWYEYEDREIGGAGNGYACKHCFAEAQYLSSGPYPKKVLPVEQWTADHEDWCKLKT